MNRRAAKEVCSKDLPMGPSSETQETGIKSERMGHEEGSQKVVLALDRPHGDLHDNERGRTGMFVFSGKKI